MKDRYHCTLIMQACRRRMFRRRVRGPSVHRQTRNHELIGEFIWAQHISVPRTGAKSSNSDARSLSHLHISLLTLTSHRVSLPRPGGSTCSAPQTTLRRQDDRPLSFLATTQLCTVQPHSSVHLHLHLHLHATPTPPYPSPFSPRSRRPRSEARSVLATAGIIEHAGWPCAITAILCLSSTGSHRRHRRHRHHAAAPPDRQPKDWGDGQIYSHLHAITRSHPSIARVPIPAHQKQFRHRASGCIRTRPLQPLRCRISRHLQPQRKV